MAPCASPIIEVGTRTCSRENVVSGGIYNNTQNSGSNTMYQIPSASPKVNNMKNTMESIDNTLRMPELHGVGSEDPKQHLFLCDMIWIANNVHDEVAKIK